MHRRCAAKTTDPINAIVSPAATRGAAESAAAELAVGALVLDVEAAEAVVEVVVERLVGRLVALIPFLFPEVCRHEDRKSTEFAGRVTMAVAGLCWVDFHFRSSNGC